MILGVWQVLGAGTRIYQNLPNSAKVGSGIVITLFLNVELNRTPEGSNIDANRNMEEKVIKEKYSKK